MSDGNFNKSLLPAGGYASGVRAGEARMKSRAIHAFQELLKEAAPDMEQGKRQELLIRYREKLG